MVRAPPITNCSNTRFPYPTLFRSPQHAALRPRHQRFALQARPPVRLGGRCRGGLRMDRGRRRRARIVQPAHRPRRSQPGPGRPPPDSRSEEHTSELQSLMRISYAVFCLKKKTKIAGKNIETPNIQTTETNKEHDTSIMM